MTEEKKVIDGAVALSEEEVASVNGGIKLFGASFDPDYCPSSPDHKHCYRTVVGVKSCLFCGGRPTKG